MKCPKCGYKELKVIDSREENGGMKTKRRRMCTKCGAKYLTHETFDERIILVTKKDGSREKFSPEKILRSVLKALESQEVPSVEVNNLVGRIQDKINGNYETDITTDYISQVVLEELKPVSEMGYIQYLIHLKHIDNKEDLLAELKKI